MHSKKGKTLKSEEKVDVNNLKRQAQCTDNVDEIIEFTRNKIADVRLTACK